MAWVCAMIICITLLLLCLPRRASAAMALKGRAFSANFAWGSLNAITGAAQEGLRCRLYLPEAYEGDKQQRYPVLYLLDGGIGEGCDTQLDSLFMALDKLIAHGAVPPLIAAAPFEGSRGAEGMRALIPCVDARFRTVREKSGRFIAGVFEGAFDALCCGLAYPQLFEACVLLNLRGCEGLERAAPTSDGTGGKPGGDGENTAPEQARGCQALLEAYAKQAQRVRFYIFAADGSLSAPCGQAAPARACCGDVNAQAAELYAGLHRRNLFSLPFARGESVPGNEAQLRIMSGGYPEEAWLEGFGNGLRYLIGLPEAPAFSPQKTVYHPDRSGSLSEVKTLQTAQGSRLSYRVHTPYGFEENGAARYPVLYLLHGSNGNDASWDGFYPALDWMTRQGLIMPLIAVAPVTGNSYWVDSRALGPTESAVIGALIPEIDRAYPTESRRRGRALAGFSMGGFGAAYYALLHPELFWGAILLSPFVQDGDAPAGSRATTGGAFAGADGRFDESMWRGSNYPALLPAYLSQALPVSIFIDAGDDDWNHLSAKEGLPADAWRYNMEYQAVQLYLALQRHGNPARLRIADGGHDETVWVQGFIEGLQYLALQGFGGQR